MKHQLRKSAAQLSVYLEERSLRFIEADQGKRMEARDLAADSEPIEPAAPVTITTFPWMRSRIRSWSR